MSSSVVRSVRIDKETNKKLEENNIKLKNIIEYYLENELENKEDLEIKKLKIKNKELKGLKTLINEVLDAEINNTKENQIKREKEIKKNNTRNKNLEEIRQEIDIAMNNIQTHEDYYKLNYTFKDFTKHVHEKGYSVSEVLDRVGFERRKFLEYLETMNF